MGSTSTEHLRGSRHCPRGAVREQEVRTHPWTLDPHEEEGPRAGGRWGSPAQQLRGEAEWQAGSVGRGRPLRPWAPGVTGGVSAMT